MGDHCFSPGITPICPITEAQDTYATLPKYVSWPMPNFGESWSKHIIKMNIILGGNSMNIDELLPIIKNEFCPYSESNLWDVCQSILDSNELRQSALEASTSEEIMLLIERTLAEKNAQIRFINNLINKEEE